MPETLKETNSLSEFKNLKETLGNGFTVTVHAGYVKLMFKILILDFYNAKAYVCKMRMYMYACMYVCMWMCICI